jgi:hypothetical protein
MRQALMILVLSVLVWPVPVTIAQQSSEALPLGDTARPADLSAARPTDSH